MAIAELDQTGAKQKAWVYADGSRIAEHQVVGGSFVEWRHPNPGTTSWITSNSNRTDQRHEMDPLGAATGTTDPYPVYLDYTDIKNGEPLYLDRGDPFDGSGGCELDGMPIPCNFARPEATVAFSGGTPNTIYHNGRFLFLQAFTNGDYGYFPQGAFSVNGKYYDSQEQEISAQRSRGWGFLAISQQSRNKDTRPRVEKLRDSAVWLAMEALLNEACNNLISSQKNDINAAWRITSMYQNDQIKATEWPLYATERYNGESYETAAKYGTDGNIIVGRRFADDTYMTNWPNTQNMAGGPYSTDEVRIQAILHELSHATRKMVHSENTSVDRQDVEWDKLNKKFDNFDQRIFDECIKPLREKLVKAGKLKPGSGINFGIP